jgi:hypothetical protein
MIAVRIEGLSADPLEAARAFHAGKVDRLLSAGDDVLLIFSPADQTHRGWRLAAVQMLARKLAPHLINAVATDSEAAISAAAEFLDRAPGLTGQLLVLDDAGAGPVLSPPP